jgi:hypothetical protein
MQLHLITDLHSIEIDKYMRICSFDIENMYTNIPETHFKHNYQYTMNQ